MARYLDELRKNENGGIGTLRNLNNPPELSSLGSLGAMPPTFEISLSDETQKTTTPVVPIPLIELQAIAVRFDFTVQQLREAAGADWADIVGVAEKVAVWARLLADNDIRAKGKVPDHYTQASECAMCGPVWLWEGVPATVLGCPWCANRDAGLLIPRPRPVICQDCEHYTRDTLNPVGGFGSCAKRQGSYLPFHRSNCFAHQPKETDK